MRTLAISIAMLALCTTPAAAFPDSFGLPRYVQVDEWPSDGAIDRTQTGSIGRDSCTPRQKSTLSCKQPADKAVRRQAPQE